MKRSILLLFLSLATLASCSAPQQQVARERTAAAALDFAQCVGEEVAPDLLRGIAAKLDGAAWRASLMGATAPAISCTLLAIVRQLRQGAPASAPGAEAIVAAAPLPQTGEGGVAARGSALTRADPAAQVQQLATRCDTGPCTDLRERAAWLLLHSGGRR